MRTEYNRRRDEVIVDGIRYAGELFRRLHEVTPEGEALRVTHADDGIVTIERRRDGGPI